MKQRKSPVALITVAVFAAIGLMIAAKPFGEERLSTEEKMQLAQERQAAEQRAKMANAPAPKADGKKEQSDLTAQMAASVQSDSAKAKRQGPRAVDENALPENPVVIKPEDKVYIPKPNSASTSSQWYDKN
ncbi:MAG: hypothetical protein CBB60_003860 [Armatimonadetes bacterium Cent15-Ar3]|jgi:hypothetical protein|nr:MAG: hypothetical protein CBB60_003860 [Armatimonadetes bacterium Cent15-Ar3]